MNPHQPWYETKRNEMERAYKAALEMEDFQLAEQFFKEYERYAEMAKGG